MLENDIREFESNARLLFPWWKDLDDVRQRVVIDMMFNLGTEGFLKFTKTIKFLEQGKFEEASREMLDSDWANEIGDRAQRLSTMMRTGVDVL